MSFSRMFLCRLNITTGSSEGAICQGFPCWRLFLRATSSSCYGIAAPTIFTGKWVDTWVNSQCALGLSHAAFFRMGKMGIFSYQRGRERVWWRGNNAIWWNHCSYLQELLGFIPSPHRRQFCRNCPPQGSWKGSGQRQRPNLIANLVTEGL